MKARRVITWVGAGVCLTLVGLWCSSFVWWVQVYHVRGRVQRNVSSLRGALWIGPMAANMPGPGGFRFHGGRYTAADGQETAWWVRRRGGYVVVPYWMLLVAPSAGTVWMFLRPRRFGPGRCAGCGYDLSGLSAACPECGRGICATDHRFGA
jgi:hypothetical protein